MRTIAASFFSQTKIFRLIICLLAVGTLVEINSSAQTLVPPASSQMDQDVKLLLQNDADVAKVRQSLHTKEISNVESTKLLKELSTARSSIFKRYDRAAQRDLTALYNAAKKDIYQAEQEAKRKIVAEERAQATAERDAARQKAAAERETQRAQQQAQAQEAQAKAQQVQAVQQQQYVAAAQQQATARADLKYLLPVSLVVWAILFFLALKSAFAGTVALDAQNPYRLLCGKTEYSLNTCTGTVAGREKDRETFTRVSGGYNNMPVTSSSTTITHLEFFLKTESGKEESFHVTQALASAAMRDGHKLSVVWAIKKGETSAHPFLFRNHSTGELAYDDSLLTKMVLPSRRVLVLSLILAIVTCVGILIYLSVIARANKKRIAKAKAEIKDKLIPLLDQAALTA